jgi:glutathione S-transferase
VLNDEAIACRLARRHPTAALMPTEPEGTARVIELMCYAVRSLHMQAFARIVTPERFAVLDTQVTPNAYACGDFRIADAAIFHVEFWADRTGLDLPPRLRAHDQRMLTRRAVRQVLAEEGYRV